MTTHCLSPLSSITLSRIVMMVVVVGDVALFGVR
jgi:hypothetical protein